MLLPIDDQHTPSEKIVAILESIDLAFSEGKNIYLHCYAGLRSTGMTVGCYLVRHGMTGEKALARIQKFPKQMTSDQKLSPKTEEQRRMVMEWTVGQ